MQTGSLRHDALSENRWVRTSHRSSSVSMRAMISDSLIVIYVLDECDVWSTSSMVYVHYTQ